MVAKVSSTSGNCFHEWFIVTNLATPSRAVVRFYNKRGTAEQLIKEGKQAVKMTRLSCHRFRSDQVRLTLSLLAYNLGNLWERLALPTNRELVADQFAATAGEDGLTAGETCPLLLVSAGGRTSESAAVRSDAGSGRAATAMDGIGEPRSSRQRNPSINWLGEGGVLQEYATNMRQFWSVLVRMGTVESCSR